MTNRIIVYLHAKTLDCPTWVVNSEVHHGEVEAMIVAAVNREVVVIVPAEDVLLLSTKLPRLPRSRLLKALPYAIEEQLIAEVESLHFAVGEYQVDGTVPVAVVAQTKMQEWLAQLAVWQIKPDVMLPLTLLLPIPSYLLADDLAFVRTGSYAGFACDTTNVDRLLGAPLALSSAYQSLDDGLRDMVQSDIACDINLLQNKYNQKKFAMPRIGCRYQVVVWGALAWLLVLFATPIVSWMLLGQEAARLDKQIAAIYRHYFPSATSVVAPQMRLQEKLQMMGSATRDNHFLRLVGLVGKAVPGIQLAQVIYKDGQLVVTLKDEAHLPALSTYLTQHGLTVKQEGTNLKIS